MVNAMMLVIDGGAMMVVNDGECYDHVLLWPIMLYNATISCNWSNDECQLVNQTTTTRRDGGRADEEGKKKGRRAIIY